MNYPIVNVFLTLLVYLELIYAVSHNMDTTFLTLLVHLASIYCVYHAVKNILLTLLVLVASIYCVSHTTAVLPGLVNGSMSNDCSREGCPGAT